MSKDTTSQAPYVGLPSLSLICLPLSINHGIGKKAKKLPRSANNKNVY